MLKTSEISLISLVYIKMSYLYPILPFELELLAKGAITRKTSRPDMLP